MERLTFGYGVPRKHVETPVPHRPAPPAEDQVRSLVLDPLPGESADWAYFGLLAFTAVLLFRPQDQLPFLEQAHLAEVSAIVGLAAMAVKRLARRLPLVSMTPELVGLLAFGGVLIATTPFSFWPGGSIEVITGMYFKVLLIVVLMTNSLNTPLRLQRFTWLILLASSYISFRAVFDYVRGINIVEGGRVAGAVKGIFGNPNDLALNMVAFLPFAALLALLATRRPRGGAGQRGTSSSPRTRGESQGGEAAAGEQAMPAPRTIHSRRPGGALPPATFHRVIAAVAVLLMLLAVVFTKSRSGFLGLAAMFGVLMYYAQRLKPGVAVVAVVLVLALLPALPSSFWTRMSSITDESEDTTGSRSARRQVAIEAVYVFLERPLTGIGPGQFKNYNPPGRQERWREAHDVWLQVASETGIFGVLTFLYLVVSAFRAALWSRSRLRQFLVNAGGVARSAAGRRKRSAAASAADSPPPPPATITESTDLGILYLQSTALVPSLVGWFVCALFASVAYNWTFYYLLGLCIVTRALTREAIAARTADATVPARPPLRPTALAS